MKVKEISNQISEGVLANFEKHGFKFKKTHNEFVRKTQYAEQIFHLIYYKENDGTITIKPEILIHVHEIESIYKSITQIESRPYLTLGNYLSEIAEYDGDEINFRKKPTKYWLIANNENLEYLIKIIPNYLENDILPYFESNSTVSRVDELLNKYPEKMCVHNYIYPLRANIAIIAAKLNNNPHYDELIKIYEKELEDAEENYKSEFYKLKELLDSDKYNII